MVNKFDLSKFFLLIIIIIIGLLRDGLIEFKNSHSLLPKGEEQLELKL